MQYKRKLSSELKKNLNILISYNHGYDTIYNIYMFPLYVYSLGCVKFLGRQTLASKSSEDFYLITNLQVATQNLRFAQDCFRSFPNRPRFMNFGTQKLTLICTTQDKRIYI